MGSNEPVLLFENGRLPDQQILGDQIQRLRGVDRFPMIGEQSGVHEVEGREVSVDRREVDVARRDATVHGSFDHAAAKIYATLDPSIRLIGISRHQASTSPVRSIEVGQGDGGYVAFLGRMAADKGVHLAIQAARLAGVPIKIAAKMAEDSEVKYFRSRVEPLLGAEVEFLGELDHDQKFELLRRASALVKPIPWDEPFEVVMIEALAVGTPVVASNNGSAPEIVIRGENGYLCCDIEQPTRGISDAVTLSRPRCRSDAEERFSMERLAADHLRVYSDMARR